MRTDMRFFGDPEMRFAGIVLAIFMVALVAAMTFMIALIVKSILTQRRAERFHKEYPNAPEVILPPGVAFTLKVKSVGGKAPIIFTKGDKRGFFAEIGSSNIEVLHPETKKVVSLNLTAYANERHYLVYNSSARTIAMKYEGERISPNAAGASGSYRRRAGTAALVCGCISGVVSMVVAGVFWGGLGSAPFSFWRGPWLPAQVILACGPFFVASGVVFFIKFRACPHCGKIFPTGKGAARGICRRCAKHLM